MALFLYGYFSKLYQDIAMDKFIINKNPQANGDHEIHNVTKGCSYLPLVQNQVDVGYFANCQQAITKAKSSWPNNKINGCYWCSTTCHTS